MTIAGFSFTKLIVEKKGTAHGGTNIGINVALTLAEEIDFVMGSTKQKGIKISFDYSNSYNPNVGSILISGEILYLSDQKRHDELMAGWKKDKKFSDDMMAELFDMISVKACVEAIHLATTVNIPPPLPLPRFKPAPQAAAAPAKAAKKN